MNELRGVNIESRIRYACIACRAPLVHRNDSRLTCQSCQAEFPVVHGIPILAPRPRALLQSHVENLQSAERHASKLESNLAAHSSARAERAVRGIRANLQLAQRYLKPVVDYLSSAEVGTPHLNDWISSRNAGWPLHEMLPYFVQDWLPSRDFRRGSALIVDALATHRPDAKTLAVFGAGACGLVKECAPQFDEVHAIEMSVPTVFIAQGVLAGDSIDVHLQSSGWRGVTVGGPQTPLKNIHLTVADASCLPFEAGSLSAVVTQYLMDIVANPLGVAAEISDALKPGGIWINFSIPFPLPGEPKELSRPTLEDLPSLLQTLQFQLISGRREKFALLDPADIDPGAAFVTDEVHFFVARKTSDSGRTVTHRERRFDWQSVPRPVPGREVSIILRTVLTSADRSEQREISVSGGSRTFPLGADQSHLISALLSAFDGQRTLRDIFETLQNGSYPLDVENFKELMFYLTERYGIFTTTPEESSTHAERSATVLPR